MTLSQAKAKAARHGVTAIQSRIWGWIPLDQFHDCQRAKANVWHFHPFRDPLDSMADYLRLDDGQIVYRFPVRH